MYSWEVLEVGDIVMILRTRGQTSNKGIIGAAIDSFIYSGSDPVIGVVTSKVYNHITESYNIIAEDSTGKRYSAESQISNGYFIIAQDKWYSALADRYESNCRNIQKMTVENQVLHNMVTKYRLFRG